MITIHQAIYGESSGHALLAKSDSKNEIFNRISGYTDLNDRPEGGALSQPIIKGIFIENHFALIKIFPDLNPGMRAGRVFSHALILDQTSFLEIKNIHDLLKFHLSSIDKKSKMEPITYDETNPELIQTKPSVREASAINAIVNYEQNKNSIVWLGEEGYWEWIKRIWSNLPKESKTKIRIGAAFNPQNVKEEYLNLIFIESELSSSWSRHGHRIIDLKAGEKLSSSIAQRLAGEEQSNSLINQLLDDFELEINSINGLSRLEDIGKVYLEIKANPALNRLLVFSNFISNTNLNSKSGIKGKRALLYAILKAIPTGSAKMIYALNYQSWKGFENAQNQVNEALKNWLNSNLLIKKDDEAKAEIVREALTENDKSNWWHLTTKRFLIDAFEKWKDSYASAIWKWLSIDGNLITPVLNILQNEAEQSLVDKVGDLEKESITRILEISEERNWLKLHGIVAIKHLKPREAFSRQLIIDKDQKHIEALSKMSEYVAPKEIVNIALSLEDLRLYKISARSIKNKPSLLSKLNVEQLVWQELWFAAIQEGADIWSGISNPINILHTLLDNILKENAHNEDLLFAISQSDYNDLADYESRKVIWDYLPKRAYTEFLKRTAHSVFEKFLSESIPSSDIEKQIADFIVSDQFMTDFLANNRANISTVLMVYKEFTALKDQFLADFITHYPEPLSDTDALNLGNLVKNREYKISAKSIYDKSVYNYSFYNAYLQCSDLIYLNFFERNFGALPKMKKHSNENKISTIVILTAINVEYQAVRCHLANVSEYKANGTIYEGGEFRFESQLIANVIIRETGPKNTTASQETEKAISNFKPKMIFFVGIAGSRKPEDFSIGDVIFPDKVYYYESGKATRDSFKARPDAVSPSHDFIDRSKMERNKDDWHRLIKGNYKKLPKADIGIIASGEQLVEHYSSEIGKIIYEHYNDASAVEMENYGFLKAIDKQGIKNKPQVSGVIRGISDILATDRDDDLIQDRRPENAKQFASDTAAAFAFWIIFKLVR